MKKSILKTLFLVFAMAMTAGILFVSASAAENLTGSFASDAYPNCTYTWEFDESKSTLYIGGNSKDGEGYFFYGADWNISTYTPWRNGTIDQSKIKHVVISHESDMVTLGGYCLAYLNNCETITMPKTITRTKLCGTFAAMSSLKYIYITDENGVVEDTSEYTAGAPEGFTVLNLRYIIGVGDEVARGAGSGNLIVLLSEDTISNARSTATSFFNNASSVIFRADINSEAYKKLKNVRDNGDTWMCPNLSLVPYDTSSATGVASSSSGVEDYAESYSWDLDVWTGELTFTRKKGELVFNGSYCDFRDWVAVWGDAIQHIYLPSSSKFQERLGVFNNLKNLKTVKCDSNVFLIASASLFSGCTSLTSFGSPALGTYEEGVIDMSYIKLTFETDFCSNWFKDCTSITKVRFGKYLEFCEANTDMEYDGIGQSMFEGCTSLTEVDFGEVSVIKANAFKGCTSLKTITLSADIATVEAGAFSGCTELGEISCMMSADNIESGFTATSLPALDIVINVATDEAKTALETLGYTNVRVFVFDGALESEGFAVRISDYNGLRSIFSFDLTKKVAFEAAGYTLVEYGAIITSKNNYDLYGGAKLTYNSSSGKYETASSKVIKKTVWNSTNGFVDSIIAEPTDKVMFAVSVVNYNSNYTADLYSCGYVVWKNSAGDDQIIYVTTDNDDYKFTNIYDVTLGMYKAGKLNAEEDTEGVAWSVLSACAVTLTSGTDYRAGDWDMNTGVPFGDTYTFADVPVYQSVANTDYILGENGDRHIYGITYNRQGDLTATLLPDGVSYVLVYRGNGTIPKSGKWGTPIKALHDTNFGTRLVYGGRDGVCPLTYDAGRNIVAYGTAGGHFEQPSPTLTSAAAKKIKTIIVDHGITKIDNNSFTDLSELTTVVYAKSVTTIEYESFQYTAKLSTMFEKGGIMEVGTLDLSGIESWSAARTFAGAGTNSVVKVILPVSLKSIPSETFSGMKGLRTVTVAGVDAIEGLVDLRSLTSCTNSAFVNCTGIRRVYLSDTASFDRKCFDGVSCVSFYTANENTSVRNVVNASTAADEWRYVVGTARDDLPALSADGYEGKLYLLPQTNEYKANLNSNTTSGMTAQQLKDAYKNAGYSILAISDRATLTDYSSLTDSNFLMLTAAEYIIEPATLTDNDKVVHFNVIAPVANDTIPAGALSNLTYPYTVTTLNAFISACNADGFLVSYNHPEWSLSDGTDYAGLKGLWAIETYNSSKWRMGLRDSINPMQTLVRNGEYVYPLATDDAASSADMFGGWINVRSENLSYENVFNALSEGDFYATTGPEITSMYIEDKVIHITCSSDVTSVILQARGTSYRSQKSGNTVSFDVNELMGSGSLTQTYVRFKVIGSTGVAHTRAYSVAELMGLYE